MILFELYGAEVHPTYQTLAISNARRHYDFLRSIVIAAVAADRRFLSQHVIKALNFHAITCLHTNPGEFRPCEVKVGDGETEYKPPAQHRVQALMDNFVNEVNHAWENADPVYLAAFVLWKMNHIHPFINGNGRTARAACYFVLCVKTGGLLPGSKILPELIQENREAYVSALKVADASLSIGPSLDLAPLHSLLVALIQRQISLPDTQELSERPEQENH